MSSSAEVRGFAPLTRSATGAVDVRDERQAARALGYAEGWATGARAAAAQSEATRAALLRDHESAAASARADIDRVVDALSAAAQQLRTSAMPTLDQAGDVVLEAAVALARTILDAELAVVDTAAQHALRRALRPLPTDGLVTVRINPADHAALQPLVTPAGAGSVAAGQFDGHDIRLVADPAVVRGDAVAEQAGSVVDAGIGAALSRALDVLRTPEVSS